MGLGLTSSLQMDIRGLGRLTLGGPRCGERAGTGVTHCGVLTICFFSVVSALTCQPFLPRSSYLTMWQYPFLQILRPGGRGGREGCGWDTGVAAPGPGKAWAGWGLCTDPPLDMLSHGVTFLAFGNGAPDIFSAMVAFSDPHTAGLAFGALFGRSNPGRGWGVSRGKRRAGRTWHPLLQGQACW